MISEQEQMQYEMGFHDGYQQALKEMNAVEIDPVRHGHWIWDDNGMDWYIGSWKCSICRCKNDNLGNRKTIVTSRFAGSNYCPHCGARMDEVSE